MDLAKNWNASSSIAIYNCIFQKCCYTEAHQQLELIPKFIHRDENSAYMYTMSGITTVISQTVP